MKKTLKNTVFLLVGQRGSGKSHYGKRLGEEYPHMQVVSRDEIIVRLFGDVELSSYNGGNHYAYRIMHRILRRKLSTQKGITILLDCWTGSTEGREEIIELLRAHGADRVIALYFVTPLKLVNVWFWQKPGIIKWSDRKKEKNKNAFFYSVHAPAHDFRLFHELAATIRSDGFDKVIKVDPRKNVINVKRHQG